MKKTYIQPAIEIQEMENEQMICSSVMNIDIREKNGDDEEFWLEMDEQIG